MIRVIHGLPEIFKGISKKVISFYAFDNKILKSIKANCVFIVLQTLILKVLGFPILKTN
jgi:hypothetical protein